MIPPLLALSDLAAAAAGLALLIAGLLSAGKGILLIIDGRRASDRRTIAYGCCLIVLFFVAVIGSGWGELKTAARTSLIMINHLTC